MKTFYYKYMESPFDVNVLSLKARLKFMQQLEKKRRETSKEKIRNICTRVKRKNDFGKMKITHFMHAIHGIQEDQKSNEIPVFKMYDLKFDTSKKIKNELEEINNLYHISKGRKNGENYDQNDIFRKRLALYKKLDEFYEKRKNILHEEINDLYEEETKKYQNIKSLEKAIEKNYYKDHTISATIRKSNSQPNLENNGLLMPRGLRGALNITYECKNKKKEEKENIITKEELDALHYNKFKKNPTTYECLNKTFFRMTSHAIINVSKYFPRNRNDCNSTLCGRTKYGIDFDEIKNIWCSKEKKRHVSGLIDKTNL